MYKVNLICWLVAISILICGAFYCKYITQQLGAVKTELKEEKAENKKLKDNWEKEKQNVIQNGRRIKELRDKIEKDKNSVDWGSVYIPDVITDVLRNHYRESQN